MSSVTKKSSARRPWTLLMIFGGCLLAAAAAAAIIEGYASDAQERSGNPVLAVTLAVVAVLVTTIGARGYVRWTH
ncbi:hypothetical protein MWU57_03320 [Isoptericola sp. S6320L]|uniref:hypothetical protein n=1 Tax=Isoptericola sp. S6320L TaxID=2926411 RepID=UPI001FF658D6|nr:hypothetical protein [Isoptericola sp. S6320L]MCK0116051.1 hypothetical protein [Isoptericola sp. S6320L]